MEECRDSTISAFNEYVNTLRSDADISARVSLTLFDDQGIDLVFDRQKPRDMPKLTGAIFVPRGMTPLNDAIAKTAQAIEKADLREGENVAFVILTDGLENASREYSRDAVRKLLARLQKEKNWLVIYLGANQDAFAEGAARGTVAANTMLFDVGADAGGGRRCGAQFGGLCALGKPRRRGLHGEERTAARSPRK